MKGTLGSLDRVLQKAIDWRVLESTTAKDTLGSRVVDEGSNRSMSAKMLSYGCRKQWECTYQATIIIRVASSAFFRPELLISREKICPTATFTIHSAVSLDHHKLTYRVNAVCFCDVRGF